MIGLVEQVLVKIVLDNSNEETLQKIYKLSGIEETRQFKTNKYYDEAEFRKFLENTLSVMQLETDVAFKIYAEEFFQHTKRIYPAWYNMVDNAHDFLLLQVKIHDGFGHSLKDKDKAKELMSKIKVKEISKKHLEVTYCSENKLCGLYIALAQRVGKYYGDIPVLKHKECMHEEKKRCLIDVKW